MSHASRLFFVIMLLTGTFSFPIPAKPETDKPGKSTEKPKPPARVGSIKIVGNEHTPDRIILRQVPLYPGQLLNYPDLLVAEKNLARLGIFEVSPDGSVKPTVTVIDPGSDDEFKDILITVEEKNSGSRKYGKPPATVIKPVPIEIKHPSVGLKELLQHYQAACDAGRMEEATVWAIRAIAIDPACFSIKPETKQGR